MKSKNRRRLINVWKIGIISLKVALGIGIIWYIFLLGHGVFSLATEGTNVTMLDYILLPFIVLLAISFTWFFYVGLPLILLEFICQFLMIFFKKKIRLKEDVFTEIKLKKRKKSSIEERMLLALCDSKDVTMLARPEGDKILIKGIKDEKEIFSIIVYEDEFYFNDKIEYSCS